MSCAQITKNALASSLKSLMLEKPLPKVSVGEISQRCGMNRKSFYYHFKDKYDLFNWLFMEEFGNYAQKKNYADIFTFLEEISVYLYNNKAVYTNAIKVWGQNAFYVFLSESCVPVFKKRLDSYFDSPEQRDVFAEFLSDVLVSSLAKWLLRYPKLKPLDYVDLFRIDISGLRRKDNRNAV